LEAICRSMMNAIRYGILLALAIFLWAVAEWLIGLHGPLIRYHEYLSYFFAIPAVSIMYWGIANDASGPGPHLGFRGAFIKGMGITFVVTLLCPLVWYVFCMFVNPDFLDNMARHAIDTESMPTPLAMKRFSLSNHLLVSSLSIAVIGTVISLVIAIIVAQRKS
jgi:hypothetical protein